MDDASRPLRSEAYAYLSRSRVSQPMPEDEALTREVALILMEHWVDGAPNGAAMEIMSDAIVGRRLRWTTDDACRLLDLAMQAPEPSDRSLRFAVRVAEQALALHSADAGITERLRRLDEAMSGGVLRSEWGRGRLQPLVRRVITDGAPGGLLDLTVIDLDDGWGAFARNAVTLRSDAWSGASTAVVHLSQPRGGRPPKAWTAANDRLVEDPDYVGLVHALLDLAAATPVTFRSGHSRARPDRHLFTEGNALLIRAAVWSMREVEADWIDPVLASLCTIASEEVEDWDGKHAISAKVALAAADVLVDRRADAQIRAVVEWIIRPDVIRRLLPGDDGAIEHRLEAIARWRRGKDPEGD